MGVGEGHGEGGSLPKATAGFLSMEDRHSPRQAEQKVGNITKDRMEEKEHPPSIVHLVSSQIYTTIRIIWSF